MGPLSQASAWKAGSYWEEMEGDEKIFLEKNGEKTEMNVEKLLEREVQDFGSNQRNSNRHNTKKETQTLLRKMTPSLKKSRT